MNKPKHERFGRASKHRTCPECGNRSLYLADAFTYICFKSECDAHFPLEYFFEGEELEPRLFDMDGDEIVY